MSLIKYAVSILITASLFSCATPSPMAQCTALCKGNKVLSFKDDSVSCTCNLAGR